MNSTGRSNLGSIPNRARAAAEGLPVGHLATASNGHSSSRRHLQTKGTAMAQIAWAAFTVFIFCMVSLGTGPDDPAAVWAILLLAAVMAVVCLCAFWHMSARPSKPVSPHFERAQALSRLDRLDGVGNRTKDSK